MLGLSSGLAYTSSPDDDKSGWLKFTYSADQTNHNSGIIKGYGSGNTPSEALLDTHTRSLNDYYTVSFKILLSTAGGGSFDDYASDGLRFKSNYGSGNSPNKYLPIDTVYNFTHSHTFDDEDDIYFTAEAIHTFNYVTSYLRLFFPVSTDMPNAGADVFVKDINLSVYNASNVLLDNYKSNFVSGIDGWNPFSTDGSLTFSYNQDIPI